ncbi:uncharacterized protein Bfra_005103 [Botrytis fragariae]|uniref:Uncharacterized protein n=1 Tax=Botrytis fragariae TaxID=1964551 RepID=A0A8H6AU04_9HELO|nr:uncharacterized protein Bfra_005103 [Botrytis fragariae]KAF5873639.1 hypothetical protein Bfra_005103 [Botrytis fragariae]
MCGRIASHRITITSTPPKDSKLNTTSFYDFILPSLSLLLSTPAPTPPVPTIVHAKGKDKKNRSYCTLIILAFYPGFHYPTERGAV